MDANQPPATALISGLTTTEAAGRLARAGPNELARAKGSSPIVLLLEQLKSPLIALLIAAAVISGILGEVAESVAIIAIVVLNAVVGFLQEYRAEKAVLALRSLTAPRARVLRDGQSAMIPAREVVEGDVLMLEGGDVVAADAQVLEAHRLTTVEAMLTGESLPVDKTTTPSPPGTPLAERHDHVFMGTAVAAGTGRAVVTGTGSRTELGHIAHLLESATDDLTPLQVQLAHVGRSLLWLCLGAVAVVAVMGLLRGQGPLELLVPSLSLAVAAVPEGLPAIVTIALAIGVQRMARRHVLVRHLPSVETLGCATVIATDKTGTLTTGEMTVREVGGPEREVLSVAAACCDAELRDDGTAVGDPTEVAMLLRAKALGITRAAIERDNPRVSETPFDSVRKRMSVLRRDGVLYVKGAVDTVLPLCVGVNEAEVREQAGVLSRRALRMLAVATGRGADEQGLHFVGMLGLADPPRPAAIEAVRLARKAGIRTVMITGDHPNTAEAIAREMGILAGDEAAVGVVYARVTPEDKLRIVRELKAKGEVVAMTGDGTNDAPALKESHVGIAMGRSGVEVTREAADMVLADDNFASIIAAIREGRGIYDNIRKSLVYLLGTAVADIGIVLGAALLALPAPLLPLHLLWINLVTAGLPALALVMDPASTEVLERKPRPTGEPMLRRREWLRITLLGVLEGAVALAAYAVFYAGGSLGLAREVVFSTAVFAQVFSVFGARSYSRLNFEVGFFSNPRLLGVVALTVALQFALVAFPPSARLLELGPFSWSLTLLPVALGLVPVSALEAWKLLRRVFSRPPPAPVARQA